MSYGQSYKWVDENGKVHFGDTVPLRYQQQAEALASQPAPTAQQKAEAIDAASRTKALAEEYEYTKQELQARKKQRAGDAEQKQQEKNNKSCEAKLKRFHESSACFNRYRNANGSLKAEAYELCKEVPRPDECF